MQYYSLIGCCAAIFALTIEYCFAISDDDLTSVRCYAPQMGRDVDCMPEMCIKVDLAAAGAQRRRQVCVCAPYNSGADCAPDLWEEDRDEESQLLAATGNLTGVWSPELPGYTFHYRRRNLLGVYLVADIVECQAVCEQFNKKGSSYDVCGSIIFHTEGSGADRRHVCEPVSTKPIRVCERWLRVKEGWSIMFLAPRSRRYGCN